MRYGALRGRACGCCVAALAAAWMVLTGAVGFCQLAETTPPPPGQLPRLIDECETGPNYAACSVWIWQGSSYAAIWGNGAAGQLTVANGSAGALHGDLRIGRRDTSGPVKGLTATYTGKWDGKSFSDGKITATLNGATNQLTWSGTPAMTPVLTDPQRDHMYVNWYLLQLTAYAIVNRRGDFSSWLGTMIDDFRMRGESPMNPAESRLFTLRYETAPANYARGADYAQASPIATIYADGTTFGDPNVLRAMLDKRKWMLGAVTGIETKLCTMGQQGASIQAISAALDKQHAAEDARSAAGKDERNGAYSMVQKEIAHLINSHQPVNSAVRQLLDRMSKLQVGLEDPVKDSGGNLVIPLAVPPLCNLQ